MSLPTPGLTTPRLQLVPVRKDHARELFLLRSNERVNQYIQRDIPQTASDIDGFIARLHRDTRMGRTHYWIIEKDDHLAGAICLWKISVQESYAEIGYELLPKHFGAGIMSEAIKEIIDFATMDLRLNTIEAYTHRENGPSIKLLTKSGFKLDPNSKDPANPNNVVFVLQTDEPDFDS